MSMTPKHQPLQSPDNALARLGLPPVDPYVSISNEALDVKDTIRFKAASYIAAGVDRVSSNTTDNLLSQAIPTSDYDRVLETISKDRTLDKADIWPETTRRRWSVDCSTYTWSKDSLPVEDDKHKQAIKNYEAFKNTDAFKKTEVFTQVIIANVQQLDIFNRDYIPTGIPSRTVFETANASINEEQLLNFLTLGGGDGWFHDNHIDTSLDLLERAVNCQKHGIAICRVGQGQELYTTAKNEQRRGYRMQIQYDKVLTEKCRNKDFILVPISDGYKDAYMAGIEYEAAKMNTIKSPKSPTLTGGHHWSLLLVDCRHRIIRGHYFDSSCDESAGPSYHDAIEQSSNAKAARAVLAGMRMMLNDVQPQRFDESELLFALDPRCPNQGLDNISGDDDGWGACGPFVFEMSKEITQYIADCHEDPNFSNGKYIDPSLPLGYQRRRNWDSAKTRSAIRNLVLRELKTRKWLNHNSEWLEGIGGRVLTPEHGMSGWKSWLREKGLNEMVFWDPMMVGCELAPQFGQPVKVEW